MTERPWYEDAALPALMRAARGSYGEATRRALASAGCDDVPRNGGFVLASLDQSLPESRFSPQSDAVASLGLSKQAASQLIDTLVVRGYLERRPDSEDRRRMSVRLTDRGRAAALAIELAVAAIDVALARRITPVEMQGLRAGLAALGAIRRDEQPS